MFTVKRPAARNSDDYCDGDIPFVASGAVNNGVIRCCAPRKGETLDAGNCITVSPVDGSSFYQPSSFLGRGGAGSSILILNGERVNLFSAHFISLMIHQTCSKYTYGHMGNKDSIRRELVQLPATNDGQPDYDLMESFGRRIMANKYRQYLTYVSGANC